MTEHTSIQTGHHLEHARSDHVPIDLDDPHRAALDDNPSQAQRPPLKTILAVLVSHYLVEPRPTKSLMMIKVLGSLIRLSHLLWILPHLGHPHPRRHATQRYAKRGLDRLRLVDCIVNILFNRREIK